MTSSNERLGNPLGLIATVAGIVAAVVTITATLVSVLWWIYGELGSIRTVIWATKSDLAETRADVRNLGAAVDKANGKIDLMHRPLHDQVGRDRGSDRRWTRIMTRTIIAVEDPFGTISQLAVR